MLSNTVSYYFNSLAKTIKGRKIYLDLLNTDILSSENRTSAVINGRTSKNHPSLISEDELLYITLLFIVEEKDDYNRIRQMDHVLKVLQNDEEIKSKIPEVLWGHIDWNILFKSLIEDLKSDKQNERIKLLFESALLDDVAYAQFNYINKTRVSGYSKIFYPKEHFEAIKNDAIERVFSKKETGLFKRIFMGHFEHKKIKGFEKELNLVVEKFLLLKQPNEFSLGKLTENIYIHLSGFQSVYNSYHHIQVVSDHDSLPIEVSTLEMYIDDLYSVVKSLKDYQKKIDILLHDDESHQFDLPLRTLFTPHDKNT